MSIFSAKTKCNSCGREIPAQAVFCPYCGKATGKGKARCGHCGAEVSPGDQFCGSCGRELASVERPSMVGQVWSRRPTDFAARVDVNDVEGFFRRAVTVEPGTNAILIQAGRSLGVMPPGQYTLDTLLSRIGLSREQPITAILVDVGDTNLQFSLTDLYTSDPIRIAIDFEIVLQLHNPVLFLTNLMRSQRNYSIDQLRGFLAPEIDNAAREYVRTRRIEELNSSVQAKRDIELDVEAHINRTLEETGLRLVHVRSLNYRSEKFDATRQITEEYYLEISRREAELAGRQMLFDVMTREDVQTLAEETQKVQVYEQRAAVLERMQRAVASARMNEVRTEEDLERFLTDIDRQRLIRANEMEELKRDFAERKQDHDLARAHLLAKLKLEHEYELKRIELQRRTDLTAAQVQSELDLERKLIEGKLANESRAIQLQLEIQKQAAEAQRAQQALDDMARRERELQDALNRARIAQVEREVERLDAELGILLLEKMKAVRRRDEEERNRIELERKARELELELRKQEAELERTLRLQESQQQFELAKMERYATLSVEALVAASGPEQARLLAELKETEALRGMTEEQILARAAQYSPQVAAAFIEKFRSSPEVQQQFTALYERLIAEQKEASASKDALHREVLSQVKEMFEKAMDTQREISTAYARQQPQGTTVIFPPSGGQAQVVTGDGVAAGGVREVIVCKKCLKKWDIGTRFCPNCGAELV